MCPISGEIITDPVIAKDGHTHERNNIVELLTERLSSPLTNQSLTLAELTLSHTLRKVIADFLATQKKRDESYFLFLQEQIKDIIIIWQR
jgi:hypothetical protein